MSKLKEYKKNNNIPLHEQKFSSALRYYMFQSMIEIKRRACYFCLAFFSVLIVVLSAAVSQSIIDRAPVIFLKLAEGNGGQIDINLTPNYAALSLESNFEPFLNATQIRNVLKGVQSEFTTPRFQRTASAFSINSGCPKIKNTLPDEDIIKELSRENCIEFGLASQLMVIDTDQEAKIGLGSDYPFPKLNEDECVIHQKLADQLRIKEGDYLFLKFDILAIEKNLVEKECQTDRTKPICANTTQTTDPIPPPPPGGNTDTDGENEGEVITEEGRIGVKLKVKGLMQQSYGKTPNSAISSVVFVEYSTFFNMVHRYRLHNLTDPQQAAVRESFKQSSPFEFCSQMIVNQKDRMFTYLDTNYDNIQFTITGLASQVANNLGVYPVSIRLPVLSDLYNTRLAAMFLGIILNIIVFILFALSLVLLYNLLLVSVETKTYELAVLRVQGLNKVGIISLILVQSSFFVIPAVILGIFLSIPILDQVGTAMEPQIGVKIPKYPTRNAVLFSMGLGILIPLFSSIFPIKNALGQTLSLALDVNRSKSTAVKITIDIEGKGFPWGRFSFAIIASLFGISIYYFLPLSLLSFNFALLINIFFWILIGMLVGMILLSLNIQYLLEKTIVHLCFFWAGQATRALVLKNLAAHRIKNRRTALMYALSMSFVIFIWTAMSVQIKSEEYSIMRSRGSYFTIFSGSGMLTQDYEELFLREDMVPYIETYGLVTVDLCSLLRGEQIIQECQLTHQGKMYEQKPRLRAVNAGFIKAGFKDLFLRIDEKDSPKDYGLDITEELYTPRGSQSAIIGVDQKEFLQLSASKDSTVVLVFFNGGDSSATRFRVSSILKSCPGLDLMGDQFDLVVSYPTYYRLGREFKVINSFQDILAMRIILKFRSDITDEGVDYVFQQVTAMQKERSYSHSIWDYRDYKESLKQSETITNLIFTFLTIIVMALSFFSLVSSMTANIMEQTKEIAILRSLGLTVFRMISVYVYEAFTLVFSSSLIGMMVGFLAGFTMSMQRALFTRLPIAVEFPSQIFIAVLVVSVLCAWISTYLPSKQVLRHPVARILRLVA